MFPRGIVFLSLFLTFMPALAGADEINWSADYRIRGFFINNLGDQNSDTVDSASYYSSRFLLTADAKKGPVNGLVTMIMGNTNGTGNRLLGKIPFGPEGNDGSGTSVGILEAKIKADFELLDFTGGRFVYKLGDAIILEDAVDGFLFETQLGVTTLGLANLKVVELAETGLVAIGNDPNIGHGHNNDADIYALTLDLKDGLGPLRKGGLFGAYLLDRSASLVGGGLDSRDELKLITAGAHAEASLMGIRIKGEVDVLSGELTWVGMGIMDSDISGLNIVLGLHKEEGFPLGLDLIHASGQDPDPTSTDVNANGIDGNYPVGIILTNGGARSLAPKDGTCLSINGGSLGGVPNCIAGSGLNAVKISGGLSVGGADFNLGAIWAQAAEKPAVGGDKDIGIELDATASFPLTPDLSLMGGAGYLIAGDFFKPALGPDPDNLLVLVTELRFVF